MYVVQEISSKARLSYFYFILLVHNHVHMCTGVSTLGYTLEVCDDARNYISILTTKLSRLSNDVYNHIYKN